MAFRTQKSPTQSRSFVGAWRCRARCSQVAGYACVWAIAINLRIRLRAGHRPAPTNTFRAGRRYVVSRITSHANLHAAFYVPMANCVPHDLRRGEAMPRPLYPQAWVLAASRLFLSLRMPLRAGHRPAPTHVFAIDPVVFQVTVRAYCTSSPAFSSFIKKGYLTAAWNKHLRGGLAIARFLVSHCP